MVTEYRRMTKPIEASDETFEREVLQADLPVLVDFWAAWCGPCKVISPIVDALATEYGGRAKVVKVDVDENRRIPGELGVRSVPTLMVFRGGEAQEVVIGVRQQQELAALLDRYVG
jgi:thioredoxin 1